ncbi:MAG: DUF554 domain-containing protein [Flavobacteriaceae bacterium]|jgi:uncharacterized membrane protein YqgA involved in biofilm formation|nr:DUF554 domain-containing protein [Flavobacteriaceae bacterium]
MVGTLINCSAIIIGTFIGMGIRSRLSKKVIDIIFQAIGLVTLIIGISMSLRSENIILIIISIILGALIGQIIDLEKYLQAFLTRIQHKYSSKDKSQEKPDSHLFVEGFLTSTLLFCIGSMSILGAIEEGSGNFPNLLITKSIMDGISSIALASSFGVCIALSSFSVLLYQGGLTLLISVSIHLISDTVISDMTAVGGILLLGLGITILKIKEISITNMLPSLVIILILSYFFSQP